VRKRRDWIQEIKLSEALPSSKREREENFLDLMNEYAQILQKILMK
jgi:hypothetical protein